MRHSRPEAAVHVAIEVELSTDEIFDNNTEEFQKKHDIHMKVEFAFSNGASTKLKRLEKASLIELPEGFRFTQYGLLTQEISGGYQRHFSLLKNGICLVTKSFIFDCEIQGVLR